MRADRCSRDPGTMGLGSIASAGCRAVLPLLVLAGCATQKPIPPSVLLVVLDTTRADAVSLAPNSITPNLSRLAAEGVAYTRARTTSAWTVPAHGSLFTGLYPSRHGAHHESQRLREDVVTLAELLGSSYEKVGFSENPHIGRQKGFAQGFDVFEETWRTPGSKRSVTGPPTVERASAWLRSRDRARPFLLFVNLMDPHLPYAPPHDLVVQSRREAVGDQSLKRMRSFDEQDARQFIAGERTLAAEELEALRALYEAEVREADRRLGQIVSAVEESADLASTLVVIVGDHGENLGEHGLLGHQLCLYETLLRVPLVFRLPGVFEGGARIDDDVQIVDVLPTVLDVVDHDQEMLASIEGYSLLGDDRQERRSIVAEYMRPVRQRERFLAAAPEFDFSRYDRRLRSIQRGNLKLILSDREETELYDLEADPDEAVDLSLLHPEQVERLRAELGAWVSSARPADPLGDPELDEEAERKLRALGYLE